MKKFFTILTGITICLFLSYCSNGNKAIEGYWHIEEYDCIFTSRNQLTPITTYPRLLFTLSADGSFSCNTDCNTISGTYTVDGDNLQFSDVACTEMACENDVLERSLKVIIPQIASYKLSGDTLLNMYNSNGTHLISLSRRK